MQGVTNNLNTSAAERGLTFSPNKTASIIFRKRNEEPIKIMLRNEIIPSKESTLFLGMTLDSKLNWEDHINKLRAKIKKNIKYYKGGSR